MNKFGIALKVRAKHGQIYNYMIDNNLTLDQMCALLDISKVTLESMLHFRWKPNKDNYYSMATIQKLEKFFDCTIEDLFPAELVEKIANNKEIRNMFQGTQVIQKEIDIEYLSFEQLPEIEYTPDFDGFELTDKIGETLKKLTPKEEKVIRLRFGFGCKEHSLEEVATMMDYTGERIRQIEIEAIRKMRYHPDIADKLRELVDV